MASINVRRGKLVVDFRYQNKRCREQTIFDDTVANRRKLTKIVERMQITRIIFRTLSAVVN